MVTTMHGAPDRTQLQRDEALILANEVRVYRAELKRRLRARQAQVRPILLNPPAMVRTMKLIDLLMAQPKIGRTKADKVLLSCRISPSKTVGGLTERQREELVSWLP